VTACALLFIWVSQDFRDVARNHGFLPTSRWLGCYDVTLIAIVLHDGGNVGGNSLLRPLRATPPAAPGRGEMEMSCSRLPVCLD